MSNSKAQNKRPRIMVIDDSSDDLYLIASILESLQYEVQTVSNPLQAVVRAEQQVPDVVLLDIQMPQMDGFECCRQLKKHSVLQEIPVIYLTSSADVESKIKAFKTGGTDYLVKPVQPDELRARVRAQVNLRQAQQNLRQKNRQLHEQIAALETAKRSLAASEATLKSVFNNAAVCIALINREGEYKVVNDRCAALFGYSHDELESMSCWQVITEEYHADMRLLLDGVSSDPDEIRCSAKKIQRKNGDEFWGECYLNPCLDATGNCLGFVCIIVDLSDQNKAEEEQRLARTVFETCSEGLVICDAENTIIMVNPAFTRITGYRRDEVLGCNPKIMKSGLHDGEFYKTMWQALLREGHWKGEIWNRRKNGDVYPELLSISVIRNRDGGIINYVSVFSDITDQKETEQFLQKRALRDPLTGLLNRAAFDEQLQIALAHAEHEQNTNNMALLYIDLDSFKHINDTSGHLTGDRVLKEFADCLRKYFRKEDIIARLGGDEFAVLLPRGGNAEQVLGIVKRLYSTPMVVTGDRELQEVCFSTGIAFYPQHGITPQILLKTADDAMYSAKRLGKGRYFIAE